MKNDNQIFGQIITDPFENRRIFREIRKIRVERDSKLLGFTEDESDFLYKYARGPRPVWIISKRDSSGKLIHQIGFMAKIAMWYNSLEARAHRNIIIHWIYFLRLVKLAKHIWSKM